MNLPQRLLLFNFKKKTKKLQCLDGVMKEGNSTETDSICYFQLFPQLLVVKQKSRLLFLTLIRSKFIPQELNAHQHWLPSAPQANMKDYCMHMAKAIPTLCIASEETFQIVRIQFAFLNMSNKSSNYSNFAKNFQQQLWFMVVGHLWLVELNIHHSKIQDGKVASHLTCPNSAR